MAAFPPEGVVIFLPRRRHSRGHEWGLHPSHPPIHARCAEFGILFVVDVQLLWPVAMPYRGSAIGVALDVEHRPLTGVDASRELYVRRALPIGRGLVVDVVVELDVVPTGVKHERL